MTNEIIHVHNNMLLTNESYHASTPSPTNNLQNCAKNAKSYPSNSSEPMKL